MTSSNTNSASNPQIPLVRVSIAELRQDPHNARSHDRRNIDAIKESLAKFGQVLPVVVRAGQIVGGNATAQAAEELGWTHLDATPADHLSAEEAVALAIALNRTAELASWDASVLVDALAGLPTLEGTGFTAEELAELEQVLGGGGAGQGLTDPDEVPEPPVEPVTRPGDLWLLGPHRLLCGDATKAEDVERLMAGDVADLVFTSPPYANQRNYESSDSADWLALMEGMSSVLPADDSTQVLVNLGLVHRDGEWEPYWDPWIVWMREHGWRRFGWYVWDQGAGLPGDWHGRLAPSHEFIFHFNREVVRPHKTEQNKLAGRMRNSNSGMRNRDSTVGTYTHADRPIQDTRIADSVVRVTRHMARGIEVKHPAVFPVDLAATVMTYYSEQGSAVYEPFMGSGTSIIAAHREGRTSYGLELSGTYTDIACRRYQEHTGEKPIREATGEPHDFANQDAEVEPMTYRQALAERDEMR